LAERLPCTWRNATGAPCDLRAAYRVVWENAITAGWETRTVRAMCEEHTRRARLFRPPPTRVEKL